MEKIKHFLTPVFLVIGVLMISFGVVNHNVLIVIVGGSLLGVYHSQISEK